MTLHVAPTEPVELKGLGKVGSLAETFGADIAWSSGNRLFGIQRKTGSDLVSSIYNGRLNHELEKMDKLTVGVLLVEENWRWTRDGEWADLWSGSQQWNKTQMWAYMASVQAMGFWAVQVAELAETVDYIQTLYQWSMKEKHTALHHAPIIPKADRNAWVLSVLCPGIGPEMSKRLMEANGGKLPLALTMSEEELMTVKGWGPKRVAQLMKALGDG